MRRDDSSKLRLLLPWFLPLALWALATGFHGFDLGKYSDDWAVSLRTPETDAYSWPASPFTRWNYFWRPLHLLVVYGLATVFWRNDWVNHLVSAAAHLGVGLLMYRLLRSLRITRAAAMSALCLFLVVPWAVEAVLWPAALGSVVAMGVFFFAALLCVRWWRQEPPTAPATRLSRSLVLVALGFTTACWHEQPAACVIALPVLHAAAGMRARWLEAVRRVGPGVLSYGIGVVSYIALFVATVPSTRRGGAGTRTLLGELGNRFARLCDMTWNLTLGLRARDSTLDALRFGIQAARESVGMPGAIAVAILLVGGGLWALISLMRLERNEAAGRTENSWRPSRPCIAAFGLLAGIGSLLPIAAVAAQPLWGRHLYALTAGAALALGAGLDGLFSARTAGYFKGLRVAACAMVAGLGLAGGVCWIGWQEEFRRTYATDQEQMRQLRALVPNPPPGAVFVPIEIDVARAPALRRFDPGIVGGLANPWSCWAYVERGYGRSDISATHLHPGLRAPLKPINGKLAYSRGVCDAWGRTDPTRALIEPEKVVAFTIDAGGTVRLLTTDQAVKKLSEQHAASK